MKLDAGQLDDFPMLTIDDLKDLTVGVYQVKLAPSYVQDTLQRQAQEELQVEMSQDENRVPQPGLLRVRVFSRFSNSAKYQLWISYEPVIDNDGGMEVDIPAPIKGYYCTCKSGARTLGTCAHITSVLWYLGFARHQDTISYPTQMLMNTIADAGNRPQQINPL